jgi:hypothetical protein
MHLWRIFEILKNLRGKGIESSEHKNLTNKRDKSKGKMMIHFNAAALRMRLKVARRRESAQVTSKSLPGTIIISGECTRTVAVVYFYFQ